MNVPVHPNETKFSGEEMYEVGSPHHMTKGVKQTLI